MFNLIIFCFLFFLVILSTFIIVDFPFIIFFLDDLPENLKILYQNSFFVFGIYKSNIQLPIMIFSSLILPLRLNIFFLSVYFYIGVFYGLNIFYGGGGFEYTYTNSYGYILFSIPILLLLSFLSRKRNRAYLFKTKYIIFISLLCLFIIHLLGLISIFMKYDYSYYYYLFISYLLIPIFSQSLLVIIFSIIAVYFNKIKYYLLEKYVRFNRNIIKKITTSN